MPNRHRDRPGDRRFRQIVDIFNATSDGTPEQLRRCIEQGCPWDTPIPRAPSLSTPINIAAQYLRPENLAILATKALEAGRPKLLEAPNLSSNRIPRQINPEGRSPAYIAVQKGNPICLGVMAKAGANLHRAIPHAWQPCGQDNLFDADPEDLPVHHALLQTVLSFTTRTCLSCRAASTEVRTALKVCSQCKMAWSCNRECQQANWKHHKKVCKKIRQGADLITFHDEMPTQQQHDADGFIPFDDVLDNDLGLDDDDNEEDYYDASKQWEYYDLSTLSWQPYPKLINQGIEGMHIMGMSKRFMYKPGNDNAMGAEEYELTSRPPPDVATNHVYYCHNIDHSIYSGCGRMVRRSLIRSP